MAGNFFQQVKSAANQAVDSTKNATRKTMLKSKIQTENSNADKLYAEVGRYYYNIHKEDFPQELGQLFGNINQAQANIAALEKELRDIEQQEQMANYNRQMNVNMQPQYQQQYQQQYNNGMPQQQYQQQYNGMQQQPYQQQMNNGMPQQQQYSGMPQQQQQMNNGSPAQETQQQQQQQQ